MEDADEVWMEKGPGGDNGRACGVGNRIYRLWGDESEQLKHYRGEQHVGRYFNGAEDFGFSFKL